MSDCGRHPAVPACSFRVVVLLRRCWPRSVRYQSLVGPAEVNRPAILAAPRKPDNRISRAGPARLLVRPRTPRQPRSIECARPERTLPTESLPACSVAPVGALGATVSHRANLTGAALPPARSAIESVALDVETRAVATLPTHRTRAAILRIRHALGSALLVTARAPANAGHAGCIRAAVTVGIAVVQRPRWRACRHRLHRTSPRGSRHRQGSQSLEKTPPRSKS